MGTLFVVATPIGNLEDITARALRVLREVDVVLCEDTRVTKKLLAHYNIPTQVESYHAHSVQSKTKKIEAWLQGGKRLALVSDAGTPGISDPGVELVAQIRTTCPDVHIEAVPGPTALTAALSIAGVPTHTFVFMGFPPHKKGRKTFFDTIATTNATVVFYESTHRILKALDALYDRQPTRGISIVKEITKIHERVISGTPSEVLATLGDDPLLLKGEFVVIVHPVS
ncbi:MAG: 16S rRNA (cytidine(1402)-2'-O)-methyltransferase [bacterium]|nr:16S rRNA (cytidine(1402)-2'-O)-methyltransferase [bacterium]